MDYVLAVDLGGTKIYSALVAAGERIVKGDERPTEALRGESRVIQNILDSLAAVTPARDELDGRLLGLGVASPGPLDPCTGVVCQAPNLRWHNVKLRQILEETLHLPVVLENDANLAALGEYLYGAGRGHRDMVFITVSTGVGGGLILRGEIYSGSTGGAGEVGHMVVVPDGPLCGCGNRGCLEAVASGSAVRRMAVESIRRGMPGRILELAGGHLEAVAAQTVTAAAWEGDTVALGILETAGRYLGRAIATIHDLLNPSLFVISGGLARGARELLLEPLQREALLRVMPALRESLKVTPGTLRGRAGVLGAAAYAWRQLKPSREPNT